MIEARITIIMEKLYWKTIVDSDSFRGKEYLGLYPYML